MVHHIGSESHAGALSRISYAQNAHNTSNNPDFQEQNMTSEVFRTRDLVETPNEFQTRGSGDGLEPKTLPTNQWNYKSGLLRMF